MDPVVALYRGLSDRELMLMLDALELDAKQPGMGYTDQLFIAGRMRIIQAEISRRSQYPEGEP